MISRLDISILRDVLFTALVCVLGLTFIFTALSLYQIVNRFEVTPHFSTLMSFAPSLWVSLLPMTMPMSALFAATLVFGRMRAERELLLLAASGVTPWRPFLMLLPIGLLTAAISWMGVSVFGPDAYAERHSLQRQALADFIENPPQGPRELHFPGKSGAEPSIDISYAAIEGVAYKDLRILVYNDLGLLATLSADQASLSYQRHNGMMVLTQCYAPRLIEFDPSSQLSAWDDDKSGDVSAEEFKAHSLVPQSANEFARLDLNADGRLDRDEVPAAGRPSGTPLVADKINELRVPFTFGSEEEPNAPKAMKTGQLVEDIRKDIEARSKQRGAAAELVRRTGLAAAGLLLPLLGALLASMINHPNRLFAIGVGVIPSALGYYPLMTAATTLAENGQIPPTTAMLIAPVATTVACALIVIGMIRGRWV
ncbi:MAG: LptF/LptG family permease [Planctomycetes bacterium]|nr:LptF/LptG family permease [Planctomycetota bacterium]